MKFAAFIMTYNRSHLIIEAIEKLLNQTFPPQKILIVDNSDDFKTKDLIEEYSHPLVEYYRVGYNSGPAGAAKIGLEILAKEGYDWIYWGDDDNPPKNFNLFESLIELLPAINDRVGIIGLNGSMFDEFNFKVKLIDNDFLKGILKVDIMSGGSSMLVNSEVVCKGISPDERLFFGFEELDFCLRVRDYGYGLYVDGSGFLQARLKANKTVKGGKRIGLKMIEKLSVKSLWRDYYSLRNAIYISFYKRSNYFAIFRLVFVSILKIFSSFRYGFAYFFTFSKLISLAIIHGLFNNMGCKITPGTSKYL